MIGVRLPWALLILGVVLLPALGAGDPKEETPTSEQVDPDYAAGKTALAARDWPAAIKSLSSAALRDTRNADIENSLGYAYRQAGQMEPAFKHYARALQLNPRHRGAHEYVGEAYLLVNDLAKAEEHLAALERICLIPCEEYEDLKKAVADYRQRAGR
jgi:tetratricopeptide (TPR) repeat protein